MGVGQINVTGSKVDSRMISEEQKIGRTIEILVAYEVFMCLPKTRAEHV